MRTILNIYLLIIPLALFISCGSTSQLYRGNDKNRILSGQFDETTYQSLRQLLASKANSGLKDTVIIKYDYNNETCWSILDQSEEEHIRGFVARHNQRIKTILANRPNVSVFDFREPGNNINKIKKWDNSIIIDSNKQLLNLIFRERSVCGNSIILLPDKRFIYLRSDAHSEALDLTQAKISGYLKKN